MLESICNNVADLQASIFMKRRLQHGFFSMNIAKFLETAFFIEHRR